VGDCAVFVYSDVFLTEDGHDKGRDVEVRVKKLPYVRSTEQLGLLAEEAVTGG
jgi:hypothetical protein